MRLRIESDGSHRKKHTRVVDAETGELIEGVRAITWSARAQDHVSPMATIEFLGVEVDIQVDFTEATAHTKAKIEAHRRRDPDAEFGRRTDLLRSIHLRAYRLTHDDGWIPIVALGFLFLVASFLWPHVRVRDLWP